MCGLCGLLGTEGDWSDSIGSTLPVRQQRLLRIAQANRILSFFGLRLEEFQGASYVLASPTGRREMVSDIGQLWRIAETLAGRRIDPLDSELLAWVAANSS